MMSAKLATPGLFKITIFEIKVMMSKLLLIIPTTKFYHWTQIILCVWSYDQSCITLAFL